HAGLRPPELLAGGGVERLNKLRVGAASVYHAFDDRWRRVDPRDLVIEAPLLGPFLRVDRVDPPVARADEHRPIHHRGWRLHGSAIEAVVSRIQFHALGLELPLNGAGRAVERIDAPVGRADVHARAVDGGRRADTTLGLRVPLFFPGGGIHGVDPPVAGTEEHHALIE